jgi:hypothetical protein
MNDFIDNEYSKELPDYDLLKSWTKAITTADLGFVQMLLNEPYNIDPDTPILDSGMTPLVWLLKNDQEESILNKQALIMHELIQAGAELKTPYIPPAQRPADIAMISENTKGAAIVVGNTLISEMRSGSNHPYKNPLHRIFTIIAGDSYRHECYELFLKNHEGIRQAIQDVVSNDNDIQKRSKTSLDSFWLDSFPESISENALPEPSDKTLKLKQEFLTNSKNEWLSKDPEDFSKWERFSRAKIFRSQLNDLRSQMNKGY